MLWWWLSCRRRATTSWWLLACIFLTVLLEQHSGLASPLWKDVCTQPESQPLPFCDTTLNLTMRVEDYQQRIPVEAQIQMMGNKAAGYDPLSIPPYQWWSEGLHGSMEPCVSSNGTCACPTSFPCPSALGTALNTTLYRLVGQAIGRQGRAVSNLRNHDMDIGDGLTYWSPNINMQRDPRWGRNQEAPGEDPHLTSHYVKAYIAGLQQPMATSSSSASTGNPNPRMQMAAGCKHLVANSLESWGHVSRHTFNAHVSEPDLRNYYFPPFQECAKQSLGVMCSYNAVNGVPACVNNWLLQDVLRDEWNFTGYIVTDCGALEDVVTGHHYAISQVQAASMASHASVDITCSDTLFLRQAHQEGWIAQDEIRDSFRRLARVQMQLGLFDNPKESFAAQDDIQVIDSPAHQQLALEAALQSIVLLQNRHQTLPLGPNIPRLAVMGPHVQATEALLSNYHGSKCGCNDHNNNNQHPFDCIETPLQAIAKANSHHGVYQQAETTGLLGCHVADTKYNDIENAIKLAKRSDVVILMVGLDQSQEREGLDRIETTLPGLQQELIMAVLKAQPFKTVIVLVNGGALSLGQDILDRAPVIVEASYGGQAASRALAQVLFGDYNPTGRLAATMYPPAYVHEIPMTEMGVSVGVGRTHRHYQGVAEFEFGHGLSYSQWQLQVEQEDVELLDTGLTEDTSDASITLDVRVTNLGPYPSSQTVLLFWRPMEAQVDILQKLIRFDQTTLLAVGESQVLSLPVQLQDFALYNQAQVYVNATVVPGMYHLEARVANGCKVTTRAWIRQAPTQDIQL